MFVTVYLRKSRITLIILHSTNQLLNRSKLAKDHLFCFHTIWNGLSLD